MKSAIKNNAVAAALLVADPKRFKPQYQAAVRQSNLPALASMGEDGQTHINIYVESKTDLGVALAHETEAPFDHEHYGPFNSIENFWHWLRSESMDDRLRVAKSVNLRRMASAGKKRRIPNFRALIMSAVMAKIETRQALKEAIIASELPFEFYYHYKRNDGPKMRPEFASWIIRMYDEIRKALKEGREPNYKRFMDHPKVPLSECIQYTINDKDKLIKISPDAIEKKDQPAPQAAVQALVSQTPEPAAEQAAAGSSKEEPQSDDQEAEVDNMTGDAMTDGQDAAVDSEAGYDDGLGITGYGDPGSPEGDLAVTASVNVGDVAGQPVPA